MYRIAICDDENTDLKKTEQMLSDYRILHPELEFTAEYFLEIQELLELVQKKKYFPDLILLDIYMPDKSGIEAARELQSLGCKGKIVFLTTSREHALDAFGVDAVQYLVKPVTEGTFFSIMDKFGSDMEKERRRFLLIQIGNKIWRVAVNDISFCAAQGKIQYIYLSDGTQHQLRMTMTEIYEMLCGYPEFVRVGVSYIVNLEHIASLSRQELLMDNGKVIYPPRGSYALLREKYFSYYCEEE